MKRKSEVVGLREKTNKRLKRQRVQCETHHIPLYPHGPHKIVKVMEIPRDIVDILYRCLSHVIMRELYYIYIIPLKQTKKFKIKCLSDHRERRESEYDSIYNIGEDIKNKKRWLSEKDKLRTMPLKKDMYRFWCVNQITGLYNKSYY